MDEREEMTLELYDELKGPRYRWPKRRRLRWWPASAFLYDYFDGMQLGDADPDIGDR